MALNSDDARKRQAEPEERKVFDGTGEVGAEPDWRKDLGITLPILCRECGCRDTDRVYATTKPGGAMCPDCGCTNVGIDPDSWLGTELAVLLRNVLGICD